MGQFGTKVISLQPVAQNKVMSVEMKKEKLKGYYEGRIVIVISWVWAEEMGNNGWLPDGQFRHWGDGMPFTRPWNTGRWLQLISRRNVMGRQKSFASCMPGFFTHQHSHCYIFSSAASVIPGQVMKTGEIKVTSGTKWTKSEKVG